MTPEGEEIVVEKLDVDLTEIKEIPLDKSQADIELQKKSVKVKKAKKTKEGEDVPQ